MRLLTKTECIDIQCFYFDHTHSSVTCPNKYLNHGKDYSGGRRERENEIKEF